MEQVTIPEAVEKQSLAAVEYAQRWASPVVTSRESYVELADELRLVVSKQRDLEELRKSLTRPLDEAKSNLMAFFNKPLEALQSAVRSMKSELSRFDAEERRKDEEARRIAEKARRDAEEAAKAKALAETPLVAFDDEIPLPEPVEVPVHIPTPVAAKGISSREVWKFEVIDPKLVPADFLIPDEKKIRAYVNYEKGNAKIAGVKIWPDRSISARSF